jgi:hypothetical protein
MTRGRSVARALLAGAAGLFVFAVHDRPAQAQTIFCPNAIPVQSGIALSNGTCTNGTTGAFSNAALASEALSDLSQSTTQQASATVGTALGVRRQTEQERCPDGFERVNGVCQRIAAPAPLTAAPAPPAPAPATLVAAPPPVAPAAPAPAAPAQPGAVPGGAAMAPAARPPRRVAAPRVATRPAPFYKAPPPPLEPAVRYTTWVQGFGDYERRTGTSSTSILCCTGLGTGGLPNPLALSGESRATMGGVLGGADATFRNLWFTNDGVILGALTGYASSNVRLTTTSISSTLTVGNGASTLNAHLEGPSAGAYITYFNERFSGDLTFRTDFLNLSESFIDTLAFTANVYPAGAPLAGMPIPGTGASSVFAGSGSTKLNNYTTNGNLNYRIPLTTVSWIEPTTGFQYTQSDYDANAAALGLTNGHLVKVQGGARYGIESYWGNATLLTTLTGLAYEDVSVTGGFIQNVAFGNNALIINDQGLLRGQGILAFNLAFNNGVSLFAQGDVRGGQDLFGAGGKGGIRVTW